MYTNITCTEKLYFEVFTTDTIFFMCSSSERSVNYATNMARKLLSSTYEQLRSVCLVRFLWSKGHIPSKIHGDMWRVWGKLYEPQQCL